jgi:hypothetical protein
MNDGRVDASSNSAVARASERWYAVCCKPRQEAVASKSRVGRPSSVVIVFDKQQIMQKTPIFCRAVVRLKN